jgi:hypothetical protein
VPVGVRDMMAVLSTLTGEGQALHDSQPCACS